jgi:hypothetical protein
LLDKFCNRMTGFKQQPAIVVVSRAPTWSRKAP